MLTAVHGTKRMCSDPSLRCPELGGIADTELRWPELGEEDST
jgi:hypothetical protein